MSNTAHMSGLVIGEVGEAVSGGERVSGRDERGTSDDRRKGKGRGEKGDAEKGKGRGDLPKGKAARGKGEWRAEPYRGGKGGEDRGRDRRR